MTTPAHPGMQSRFGDNQPPPSADPLRERLEETYREQLALVDHLVAEAGRVPPINDDRIAGAVGDYVKECVAHEKALNAIRVGEKEPYLHGGRTVDAVFTAASERLRVALLPVRLAMGEYLRQKEAAMRAEAEAAAAAKALESQRLAAQALALAEQDAKASDHLLRGAAVAETQAMLSQLAVEVAKPADFARLRGAGGAVSTLRSYWTHCDLDRGKIDLEALRPHFTEQAIVSALGAYIKAGGRSIVGATIFEATAATVR